MRPAWTLVVALVAVLPGCLGAPEATPEAPAFSLVTTDGDPVNLSTYEGRYLVLDLMATWCPPCKREMVHLATFQEAHPDVAILSVSVEPGDTDADLEAFRAEHGGTWPFARDTDDVGRKFDLGIIPKLVIIDPQGRIVFENDGETYPATMSRLVGGAPATSDGVAWMVPLALVAGLLAPFNPYATPKAARYARGLPDEPRKRRRLLAPLVAGVVLLAAALVATAWTGAAVVGSRLNGLTAIAGVGGVAAGVWALRRRRVDTAPMEPTLLGGLGLALDAFVDTGPLWVPVLVVAFSAPSAAAGVAAILVYVVAFLGGAAWTWPRLASGEVDPFTPTWGRWTSILLAAAGVASLALWLGLLS